MPRIGKASTMCSSRGAAVSIQCARDVGPQRVECGCGGPAGQHHGGDHPLAQPLVGQSEHRAVGHRGMGPQRGFDRLRQHRQPAGADRVVDAAQNAEHSRIVNDANVVGAKPAGFGEGVGVGRIAIALGQSRAAEHDPAVVDAKL